MITSPIPHFIPAILFYFLLLSPTSILAINITSILSSFPTISSFSALLSSTGVATDLSLRASLTLFVIPNMYLPSSISPTRRLPPASLSDTLRYHVLLEYFSPSDLQKIPPSGKLVTTLFQTTGRATSNFGSVNITRNPSDGSISIHSPALYSPSNVTLLSLVKNVPYNVSIYAVNSLLVPFGVDLTASDARPPLGLNITKALTDGHNFNVIVSMLIASGVVEEFEADEGGAGITLFVPTDASFAGLPANERLQSLPADRKAVVLKFHVLHSYYPLGSLESIVNPVQPTLATEDMGAGSYTLNISRVNGSVAIDTGIVQASVTQTVFDENPVAIFGVSRVLLPREIFSRNSPDTPVPGGDGGGQTGIAQPPKSSISPGLSPSHLSSPPGVRDEITTGNAMKSQRSIAVALFCIILYLLV